MNDDPFANINTTVSPKSFMDFSQSNDIKRMTASADPDLQSEQSNQLSNSGGSSGAQQIRIKQADPKLLDKLDKETKKKQKLLLTELKKK